MRAMNADAAPAPAKPLLYRPILYRVRPADPAGHRYHVSVTVAAPDPQGQRLSLPAWIPGSYLIRDFSRHIETIAAESRGGAAVALEKIDSHTWRAAPCAGPLVVSYTVYAWDLSVRGAHLDERHGFFNGASVFLCVEGQAHLPCLLDIQPNRRLRGWRVYTSLPVATGLPGAARRFEVGSGFGLYRAPDYDALIDHPVEMGTPQTARFTVHGAVHELVFTGVVPNLDIARIAKDVARICAAQIEFFEPEAGSGKSRAPFLDSSDRYVFLTMVTDDGYGGLEHRASTALMAARRDLPVIGQTGQTDGYRRFLGLVSHEYFHTWHVKRIKPAAFVPYDLARETHTRLLWVFEGFTSYYDDLLLLRAGLVTREQYLDLLAQTITRVEQGAGRLKQSVAQSSFDAWTRYYKQDENAVNAIVSYYTKGALAALGLDLLIRRDSHHRYALDDVMRLLWRRYGCDFYRSDTPQGVPENAIAALVREATGVDVQDFIDAYVDGTRDVPLAELLADHGITLRWQADGNTPGLDATVRTEPRTDGARIVLASVHEGGAAHRAGLSAHDVLVAIDGLRVDAKQPLATVLAAYRPGDTVRVHVFRRDELRDFTVKLAAPPQRCVLAAAT